MKAKIFILMTLAILTAATAVEGSTVVSVNYYRNNTLGAAEVAGAVPMANWNNVHGNTYSTDNLLDSDGVATTIDVAHAAGDGWNWGTAGSPNEKLMQQWVAANDGIQLTVSDIGSEFTSVGYDVIVYLTNTNSSADNVFSVTIGTETFWIRSIRDTDGILESNPYATQAEAEVGVDSEYVRFTGLTGSSFLLELGEDPTTGHPGDRPALAGIQIVVPIDVAWDPNPEDTETLVSIETDGDVATPETTLSWNAPTAYDSNHFEVYFEIAGLLTLIDTTEDTFTDPSPSGDLSEATTYDWRIITYDTNDLAHPGPIWSFTTNLVNPPVILTSPNDAVVDLGASPVLSVTTAVADTWEWFKDDVSLLGDAGYSGANTASLTILSADASDDGVYHCVASLGGTFPATSDSAQVTVKRQIGWWKLDGTLTDSVTGSPAHDGSATSTSFVPGIDGQALEFDGDPNYIVTIDGSSDDFNFYPYGLTVSAWVKTTNPDWGRCVAKEGESGGSRTGFALGHLGDQAVNTLRDSFNLGSDVADPNVASDQWHYIVATYDGTTRAIYVDGALSNSEEDLAEFSADNAADLILGALNNGEDPFIGLLDDVQIYNYAIGDAAIAAEYTTISGKAPCLEFPAYDIAGPDGIGHNDRDCIVNLHDFAAFAGSWLDDGY